MRIAKQAGRRMAAAAVVSGMLAAGTLAVASGASASTVGTGASEHHLTIINERLQAMPAGTVVLFRDEGDNLSAQVTGFGFTPGSSHTVELVRGGHVLAEFNRILTVSSTGHADEIDLSSAFGGAVPAGSRIVILNGTASDPVSTEPIAKTGVIVPGVTTYRFHSVEVSPDGLSYGTPRGVARIVYNPVAQTITVTVDATGVTPGLHAAHIHDGSCMSQGPVQYMLMDFMANAHGQIIDQSRTVTGVTSPIPATGWYLNLHQGNSNNILANGQPTINFRPLLCADI